MSLRRTLFPVLAALLMLTAGRASAAIERCGKGARVTCVVDGDTLWVAGTKIRLADINTPETFQPGCAEEKALGQAATRRLIALLNAGPVHVERPAGERDEDRYGRKLRVIVRNGESLGSRLVAEGLAEPWSGRRRDWCRPAR